MSARTHELRAADRRRLLERGWQEESPGVWTRDGWTCPEHEAWAAEVFDLPPPEDEPEPAEAELLDAGRSEPSGDDGSFRIPIYPAPVLAALAAPNPADPITDYVRRGMATLVGGITGHGKSTWIFWQVRAAADAGAKVLVVDLEQHLQTLQRLLREMGLEKSSAVEFATIPEGLALDKRTDQLEALETILAAGSYDLAVFDPFYKLHEADSSDEREAKALIGLLRRWIAEYGFGLLMATHCRKLPTGRAVITLDDLYGSSVFTRDPELVLGIQRHANLTKLHVFKSREPGLEMGQVFEFLFSREGGYSPKPEVDPEVRAAELERIGVAATEWIERHPGESTNAVKKNVGGALKVGGDKVESALERQVKSGLLPEPVRGSRNAKLWYPLNHAALTSPGSLLSEVTEGGAEGIAEADFTRPSDLYVVEERSGK